MRLLLILLALCGCQSASPLRLYDGPARPPEETARISLTRSGGFSTLWKNELVPQSGQIVDVNGRQVSEIKIEVLPGKQKLLIEGYYEDPGRASLLRLLDTKTRITFAILTKQVEFSALPGRTYFVQAKAEGDGIIRSFEETKTWSYIVRSDSDELVDSKTMPWTPVRNLPDLHLGHEWTLCSKFGNRNAQGEGFVGPCESEVKFSRKVYSLTQTGAAARIGSSLDSVTKQTGSNMRRFIQIPGARIFDIVIGEQHWTEKWRDAYADGKGKWGVTVYRVHENDIVMLAYVGQETDDAAVLDQWVKRFLDANLPNDRHTVSDG
ncbi:MAG: hypothetical protein JKY61_08835 [Planctomycetes bacterium]|nr:hypothetical protein [Planctomycetota bacterium]